MARKPHCGECYLQGYCRELRARLVTTTELTPVFIAGVRRTMRALGLTQDDWESFLTASYRDYPGTIVDARGNEVSLDTAVFDRKNIRTWFRDLSRPLPENARPRLRKAVRKRFAVLATILRALYPVEASFWGVTIANDRPGGTVKPVLPAPSLGCPYADPKRIAARLLRPT